MFKIHAPIRYPRGSTRRGGRSQETHVFSRGPGEGEAPGSGLTPPHGAPADKNDNACLNVLTLKRTSSHGPGPPRRVALSHEGGSEGQLSRAERRGVVYILKSSSCWERTQETSKQAPGDPGLLSNVQLLGDKHPRAEPTEPSERTLTQAWLLNEGRGVWVSVQSAHPVGTQRVGFLVRRAAARDDPTARGPSPLVALMVSALRPAVT